MPDRIYAQYRDKPKAVAWYNIISSLADEFGPVADGVRASYDIDSATTYELDVLGRIVVQSRNFESEVSFTPFQYGDPDVQYGDPDVQYQQFTGSVTKTVSNEIYRVLVRAKIVKNNSSATISDITSAVSFVTGSKSVVIVDREDMSFGVNFQEKLDEPVRFVLMNFDVVPRPQGVQFIGFIEEPLFTSYGSIAQYGDPNSQYNSYFEG